jgi:hypothetical protein
MTQRGHGSVLAATLAATLSPDVLEELSESLAYLVERRQSHCGQEQRSSNPRRQGYNRHHAVNRRSPKKLQNVNPYHEADVFQDEFNDKGKDELHERSHGSAYGQDLDQDEGQDLQDQGTFPFQERDEVILDSFNKEMSNGTSHSYDQW